MISEKEKEISPKAISIKENDIDDLKQFVQKKKNQNVALKKLIENLNTKENLTINKFHSLNLKLK